MKNYGEIGEENKTIQHYDGVDCTSYEISPENFSKILNASLASLNIHTITTLNEADEKIIFDPLIHLIIGGQPGSFKSTLTRNLIKIAGGINISSVTAASLMGVMDKEGNFTEPLFWQARDGILCFDDWSPILKGGTDTKYMDSLLKFLEDYAFTKKFVWKNQSFKIVDEKNKSNMMVMEKGLLNVHCKVLLIANTMRNFIKKKEVSVTYEALLSRCLFIHFNPARSAVRSYIDGKTQFFRYKKIKVAKEIKVSKKDYKVIVDYIFSRDMSLANTTRTIGLFVRFYAVYGFHDYDLYDEIIRIRNLRG